MALVNEDRVVLNAALRKLQDNEDVEESIEAAEEVIRKYADLAAPTAEYIKSRQGSEWLEQRLSYQDLKRVGLFSGRRRRDGDTTMYSFTAEGLAVEFYFVKGEYPMEQWLKDFEDEIPRMTEDEQRAMSARFVAGALSDKVESLEEMKIGDAARSLNIYNLDHVDLVGSKKRVVWGIKTPFDTEHRYRLFPRD